MLLYSSQISHLCRLFFWQYSFSHHLRFMTTGEDRNKDRFKTWKFCGLWKLPFRHHGAVKFTQNCVCYTTPCINPFVPTSVTHEYYPKVLEHLHLLHCISAHLLNTLPWVFWETQYLNLFSADFRSCLVQRSRKPIKCVLKTLMWRSTDAAPIRLQKANGSPYSANSDTLFDASATVYPIHTDHGSPNVLEEDHISYCITVRGQDILPIVIFSGYISFY